MRIECPSCAAAYDIPDRLLQAGPRALRCAACGTTWMASLPGEVPSSDAPKARMPEVEPRPTAAEAPAPPPGDRHQDGEFAALLAAVAQEDRRSPPPRSPDAPLFPGSPRPDEEEFERAIARLDRRADGSADEASSGAQGSDQVAAAAEPEPPIAAPPPPPPPPRPSAALVMAWLATLGALGAVVLTLALFPQGVVARWPAAARLYELVGLTPGVS
ncbi:MAG TPA: zinc-ribbon domain-containing protein [Acetobacteraceae bacterium]|nr:zinc-ribbon domain-containing protein [Acetobacteraceae bacterium]